MTQQLFINGKLADIDEANVMLSIRSNLLQDISKLQGNTTYTVKLPMTSRNRLLFGLSDSPQSRTDYPYIYHRADYYRNGVQIIASGQAVLLSVGEEMEISITWGVSAALLELIKTGAKLNELDFYSIMTFVEHPTVSTWGDFLDDANFYPFWADADFHKPLEDAAQEQVANTNLWNFTGLHPTVRVPFLLQRIAEQYGVEFSFDAAQVEQLKTLCIPLIDDKPSPDVYSEIFSNEFSQYALLTYVYKLVCTDTAGLFSDITDFALGVNADTTISVQFDISFTMRTENAEALARDGRFVVEVRSGSNVYNSSIVQSEIAGFTTEYYSDTLLMVRCRQTVQMPMEAGQYLSIWSVNWYQEISTGQIRMYSVAEHLQFGNAYPIAKNLPDVKIVDFLKCIFSYLGVFPLQPTGNTIAFKPFGIFDRADAYDWSEKLIPAYETDRPREIKYRNDGWAQENWYRWKESEGYDGSFDGSISIEDTTLEPTRDVIKFPFSIAKTGKYNRRALIPIYALKNFDELQAQTATVPEYSHEKVEPLLLVAMPAAQMSVGGEQPDPRNANVQLGTDGLKMSEVITLRYGNLVNMLSQARLVTERFRLTDVELMRFDETRAVYLAQYARYFAVLKLDAQGDGTAKAELLMLKNLN